MWPRISTPCPSPIAAIAAGWVFRNEKPGPGRFRQFMQFDADTVGAASVAADAEICMMAADTLERLGLKRGDYVIKINNRKVLDGVLEAIGLGGEDKAGQRLTVLRAIDKLDRLGPEGVRQLLGAGPQGRERRFHQGRRARARCHRPRARLHGRQGREQCRDASSNLRKVVGSSARGARRRRGAGGDRRARRLPPATSDRVVIDPSVVRGLEYYTGPVYEAELTFQVQDEDGSPSASARSAAAGAMTASSAASAPSPFRPPASPSASRGCLSALQMVKSPIVSGAEQPGPVVVLVMDKDQIAAYQRMVSTLRQAGIRAELYLGSSGMKAQMKYADKRQSPCVVIQGSNERERGEVEIKDLIEGAKAAEAIASNEEWKAARPAQFSVSRGQAGRGRPRGPEPPLRITLAFWEPLCFHRGCPESLTIRR